MATIITAAIAPNNGTFFFISVVLNRNRLSARNTDISRNPETHSQTGRMPSGICMCVIPLSPFM
jgi:hypothetical protein